MENTFNPILRTAWLENHATTLKNNTAKYYLVEKSNILHNFQQNSKFKKKEILKYGKPAMICFKYISG
jgi:hypothetical protein